MDKLRTRKWLGSIIWILSLILLLWAQWPIKSETRDIIFRSGELQIQAPSLDGAVRNTIEGSLGVPLAFQDARKVTLEWTPVIRKGDHSQIIISFSGDNASLIEDDNVNSPENLPRFENLYHVYTVNAEARVELSGINEKPDGIAGIVLPEGQNIEFIWEIIPNDDGLFNGIAWLYLQFFPIKEGVFVEQAISAQSFEVKVISFLGLNSNYWRVISVLGIIIGIYIQNKRIIWHISRVYKAFTKKNGN